MLILDYLVPLGAAVQVRSSCKSRWRQGWYLDPFGVRAVKKKYVTVPSASSVYLSPLLASAQSQCRVCPIRRWDIYCPQSQWEEMAR